MGTVENGDKDEFVYRLKIVRLCIHVCIRGMVFVQKGNWSFRIAELVSLCIERGGWRFWLRLRKVEMAWGRDDELAPGSCTGWRLWGVFAAHSIS